MNALAFLGIAALLSVVGCGVLWLRSRQPGSMEAHIREFAKELDALAPGAPPDRSRRGPSRHPGPEGGPAPGADQPPASGLRPPRRPGPGPEWPERETRPRSG